MYRLSPTERADVLERVSVLCDSLAEMIEQEVSTDESDLMKSNRAIDIDRQITSFALNVLRLTDAS